MQPSRGSWKDSGIASSKPRRERGSCLCADLRRIDRYFTYVVMPNGRSPRIAAHVPGLHPTSGRVHVGLHGCEVLASIASSVRARIY